jgi:hypothetical protein
VLVKSDTIGGQIECKRLVECNNANEWSVPMQTGGQVECNFAGSLAQSATAPVTGEVMIDSLLSGSSKMIDLAPHISSKNSKKPTEAGFDTSMVFQPLRCN